MNSAKTTKKKLSEYQVEDLKDIFLELLKKISSKIILLEIGNDFINIGLAKSQKNKLYIKKILRQPLPQEALDKSIPTDPVNFGFFLKEIISLNKFHTNRVAIVLPSDTCYTRLIEIPENVDESNSTSFLENPNSGIQIPISLENSDFEINLTNLPQKEFKNKIFNKYFLTSIPKKNLDTLLDSIKNANLEICSIQMSHMCIASLLRSEINKLSEEDLIISIDLLDEFTQFVIFDRSGPLLIKRLASIRNYPSIEEMKKINTSNVDKSMNSKDKRKSENYHALSKLDLKVLLREIKESFNSFLSDNNLNKKGKIFLSGRNSQHKNLVELIGKNLMMDVALVSPVNNNLLREFSYNADEINQFSMSRIVGLGLTLMKDINFVDETLNNEFIIQEFSLEDFKKEESKKIGETKNNEETKKIEETKNNKKSKNNENYTITNLMNSLDKLSADNLKIKEKVETKTKSEEKKKELPPLPNLKIKEKVETKTKSEEKKKELPPLPNLKIKEKVETKTKSEEKKKELPPLPNLKIKEKVETKTKSEEKKKELPPLPNLKIKEKVETKTKSEEKKKELPPLPNLKIKEKVETKTKSEEKKKELPPLPNLKIKEKVETKTKSEEKKKELPPLPNLKIKEKVETKTKSEEKKKELPPLPELKESKNKKNEVNKGNNINKQIDEPINRKNKSFKMDTSFLEND